MRTGPGASRAALDRVLAGSLPTGVYAADGTLLAEAAVGRRLFLMHRICEVVEKPDEHLAIPVQMAAIIGQVRADYGL